MVAAVIDGCVWGGVVSAAMMFEEAKKLVLGVGSELWI